MPSFSWLVTAALAKVEKPALKRCDMHVVVTCHLGLGKPTVEVSLNGSLAYIFTCNTHGLSIAKHYSVSILKCSKSYDMYANCYIRKPIDLNRFIEVIKIIENFWLSIVELPPSNG